MIRAFRKAGFSLALVFILSAVPGAYAEPLSSTLKDQQNVALTIYNSNVGLVKDLRALDLKRGVQELKFMDVAGKIDPTTVHIKSLVEAASLMVLEQNYEYDLLSPQKLLEKFVGQKDSAGHDESRDEKRRNRGSDPPLHPGGEHFSELETRSTSAIPGGSSFPGSRKTSSPSRPWSGFWTISSRINREWKPPI